MSEVTKVLLLGKRALVGLGLSVLAAAALVAGNYYSQQALHEGAQEAESMVRRESAWVARQKNDLQTVQTNIQRYQELRASGLIGEAPRVAWLEQLQQLWTTLGFTQDLRMELKPAQPLQEGGGEASPNPMAFTHDLVLEVDSVLETEILDFLERARQTVKGRFRVQECQFSNPNSTGMMARCTLRFFNLTEATAEPATQ